MGTTTQIDMPQLIEKSFEITNSQGQSSCLLVCEHASNFIPDPLANLGLDTELLHSHISWDPGAVEVARRISRALDAPLFSACVSRLVYDCNRPPSASDAIVAFSEVHEIPGNQALTQQQRLQRIARIYQPFRDNLSELIKQRAANQQSTILITIHSFVPVYKGVQRTLDIGILHDSDTRLADALLAPTDDPEAFIMRRNEPYGPEDGVTHTLKEHALPNGLANVMIEIRNDLIADAEGQQRLADFLAEKLQQAQKTLNA